MDDAKLRRAGAGAAGLVLMAGFGVAWLQDLDDREKPREVTYKVSSNKRGAVDVQWSTGMLLMARDNDADLPWKTTVAMKSGDVARVVARQRGARTENALMCEIFVNGVNVDADWAREGEDPEHINCEIKVP